MSENPCEGCLVEQVCEKMCPRVIEYYGLKVRKRSKEEIEDATGYLWREDPDQHDFFSGSIIECPKHEKYPPTLRIKPNFKKISIPRKIFNYYKKGLTSWLQKNKNISSD